MLWIWQHSWYARVRVNSDICFCVVSRELHTYCSGTLARSFRTWPQWLQMPQQSTAVSPCSVLIILHSNINLHRIQFRLTLFNVDCFNQYSYIPQWTNSAVFTTKRDSAQSSSVNFSDKKWYQLVFTGASQDRYFIGVTVNFSSGAFLLLMCMFSTFFLRYVLILLMSCNAHKFLKAINILIQSFSFF